MLILALALENGQLITVHACGFVYVSVCADAAKVIVWKNKRGLWQSLVGTHAIYLDTCMFYSTPI